jgi:predicted dehydrogenase
VSGPSWMPLRAAIVGCGNVAVNDHAPAYLALPDAYRVVALVDPSPERRAILAKRLGLDVSAGFSSLEDALAATPIDVVDICTPPALHRRLVEAAAAARCDVLCEKPLATAPADAVAIADAVTASGIRFGMIHNYQWFPEVIAMRGLIAEGVIGRLQVVLIDSLGVADNPGAAAYRPGWRHELDAGGGVLMDLIHLVYLAEFLLGGPIQRVSATVDAVDEANVESIALCRFDTDERGSALVNVGWGIGPGGMRASGTEGRIEVRYQDGGTGPWSSIEVASLVRRDGQPQPITIGSARATHRAVLQDFADAVATGRSPSADVAAGVRAVMSTVAAYESAATGATIRVPLDRGDPAYRSGVAGIAQLDLPDWSPIRRRGLFGRSAR